MDTQVDLDETPGTPERVQSEVPDLFRSPGAVSEMSGTTAITSFSMVEAEFLEPRFILKHLRKLCESAEEFLEHIAPDNAGIKEDMLNMQEIQKPDSDYTEEYRDYDVELNVHLKHFKSEEHSYIHIRALHRALFGINGNEAASQSGLDLILYLTNLLVFAKNMIHSDRNAKESWDVLRQLDNTFPGQFMTSLCSGNPASAVESALIKDTFQLALELRTQLTILVLDKSAGNDGFDPNEIVNEIFFRLEASQAVDGSLIRGWNILALGGDEASLPKEFRNDVMEEIDSIKQFFATDDESLQRGELVDLEGLWNNFPWQATILRLLQWVRLRHRELHAGIEELGGAAVIARNVKQALEEPQPPIEPVKAPSVPRESPRRKRTSFGRDRRRSSRKFDPNAEVDLRTIDALKAKERDSGVHFEVNAPLQPQEEAVQQTMPEAEDDQTAVEYQPNDVQPVLGEDEEQREKQLDEQPEEQESQEQAPQEQQIEELEEQIEAPRLSDPPQSSAALLKALKAVSNPQKENRPLSIFDRHTTAQRVEFGDGFDESQPTPGPSTQSKGKQPAQSSSRKRARPVDDDDDEEDDSDAFESTDRGLRVPERRRNAPITKKVRIEPPSSSAPTSHQPRPRPSQQPEPEQEESVSETEAPDMTEQAPPQQAPPSSYRAQKELAEQNHRTVKSKEPKVRQSWSIEAEDAFMNYMHKYPCKYSAILHHDKTGNGGLGLLQDRTQVNLKDKAFNMAANMIK
jgi:hypothetical protein